MHPSRVALILNLIPNPLVPEASAIVVQLRKQSACFERAINFNQLTMQIRCFQSSCPEHSRKARQQLLFSVPQYDHLNQHIPCRLRFDNPLEFIEQTARIEAE